MGHITLVRHGQASFGADDYDQLSPRGRQQSERLGAHLQASGQRFDWVLLGTLKRHKQTLDGMVAGGLALPPELPIELPGLNEYDSAALIHAIHPEPLERPTTPELYRHHFRLLRDALRQWMDGVISPHGMPSYSGFVDGVHDALHLARARLGQSKGRALIVSSGGPISTALGQVLSTPPETTIELNFQLRNTALCELVAAPKHFRLLSYNHLPHLSGAGDEALHTHA